DAALALEDVDVAILAAAVADYRPAVSLPGKRPKDDAVWQLELEPTEDIARLLGERDRGLLVLFRPATGDEGLARKGGMLDGKNADLVVYNDIGRTDIGFDAADNEVVLVSRDGERHVPRASKAAVAVAIMDAVEDML